MNGIQCIIGLGNPGAEYAKTRHNVGAWFVDFLADQHTVSFKLEKKLHGEAGQFSIDGKTGWLFKPTTYMNDSGLAIASFLKFYKIPVGAILIAHDELDFDAGIARLKRGGGHGGHNGLRDIVQHIGSDFYRLRLGIGHPGHKDDVTNYVLGTPSKSDRADIVLAMDEAARVMSDLIAGKIEQAFHELHSD